MLKIQQKRRRKNKTSLLSEPQICIKCITNQYIRQLKQYSFEYLSIKYSNSQKFFYTKDINECIQGILTAASIKIKDFKFYDNKKQYMKQILKKSKSKQAIHNMAQYYKYYNTQAKFFIPKIDKIMTNYKNKKKAFLYKQMQLRIEVPQVKQTITNNQIQYKLLAPFKNFHANKRETLLSTNAQIVKRRSQYEKRQDSLDQIRQLNKKLEKTIKKFLGNKKQKTSMNLPDMNRPNINFNVINQLSTIQPVTKSINQIVINNYDNYGLIKFRQENQKKNKCMKKKQRIIQKHDELKKKSSKKNLGQKQLTTSNSKKQLSQSHSKNRLNNLKKKPIQIDNNLHKRSQSQHILKQSLKQHKHTTSSINKN